MVYGSVHGFGNGISAAKDSGHARRMSVGAYGRETVGSSDAHANHGARWATLRVATDDGARKTRVLVGQMGLDCRMLATSR